MVKELTLAKQRAAVEKYVAEAAKRSEGHGHGAAAVAVYDGYWRAPIPLTRYGLTARAR